MGLKEQINFRDGWALEFVPNGMCWRCKKKIEKERAAEKTVSWEIDGATGYGPTLTAAIHECLDCFHTPHRATRHGA